MKKELKIASLLLAFCFFATCLFSCNSKNVKTDEGVKSGLTNDTEMTLQDDYFVDSHINDFNYPTSPSGDYSKDVVLVKSNDFSESLLGDLDYSKCEQLYNNSPWYRVSLNETTTATEAIEYLNTLNSFIALDYDYIMTSTVDVSDNTYISTESYLSTQNVYSAWDYLEANGSTAGGTSDIIVAVIDSGVDYNHIDLRNNIWINTGEIPENGIDDDGNGYIDDYHGWDFVGNDSDPMDDHGHGTHVAGIIAAENNSDGIVGIAFNSSIMCLKAADLDGNLNSSNVAEAIHYARMNGASVINMSFGGEVFSGVMYEALQEAYNQCVLVAAAGNSGKCNESDCVIHKDKNPNPTYPAAFPFVIGVMSCNNAGTRRSDFSNFDHYYFEGDSEYNVYAPGENIMSTLPGNKYKSMSGTSMAAPVISGMAALMRSYYTDRNQYSTKFIISQLVHTGTNTIGQYKMADSLAAFTSAQSPDMFYSDYKLFDGTNIDSSNNNNGFADAGEVLHIGIDSLNVSGVAKNIRITLTMDENDGHTDFEYVTIDNNQITVSDIGVYSTGTGGYVYDSDNNIVDYTNCFTVRINANCPHNLNKYFNVTYEYENGLDSNDTTVYSKTIANAFLINISNGEILTGSITSDLTLTSGKKYLIRDALTVEKGVTLTLEKGVILDCGQAGEAFGRIVLYGTLVTNGTVDEPVRLLYDPNDQSDIQFYWYGAVNLSYTIFSGIQIHSLNYNEYKYGSITSISSIDHCTFESYLACYATNITNSDLGQVNYYMRANNDLVLQGNKISSLWLYTDMDYRGQYPLTISNNLIGGVYIENRYRNLDSSTCLLSVHDNVITGGVELTWSTIYQFSGFFEKNMFTDLSKVKQYRNTQGEIIAKFTSDNDNLCDYASVWPFIMNIEILDSNNSVVETMGAEEVTFAVTFNRDISNDDGFTLQFGSWNPYSDYMVTGSFVSSTRWEGQYTLTSTIEGGQNRTTFINSKKLYSSTDEWKSFSNSYIDGTFRDIFVKQFTIDVSHALSMNLFANPTPNGVELSWIQDDYDTLMGYNVYRSNEKDGNYVKLNGIVIPPEEGEFLDENAEPGKTYWYTFTVVLSDMSESAPAGKISCTTYDTLAPSVYHTPVNQGYLNYNLVISCTASDNVEVSSVSLYYRTVGESLWNSSVMSRQNDRYSATVFGSELSLDGIEYYITVSDGVNTITKGSPENPYSVIIKESSSISRKGDVNGDGVVTTIDALMIMQAINGDLILTDDQFIRADLNADDVLSSAEALRILQFINGSVSDLNM